jgi:hypothetical protein
LEGSFGFLAFCFMIPFVLWFFFFFFGGGGGFEKLKFEKCIFFIGIFFFSFRDLLLDLLLLSDGCGDGGIWRCGMGDLGGESVYFFTGLDLCVLYLYFYLGAGFGVGLENKFGDIFFY